MLTLNHQKIAYQPNETVYALLKRTHFSTTFVAVEVNGRLIKRENFEQEVIPERATIEVFSIVGGG